MGWPTFRFWHDCICVELTDYTRGLLTCTVLNLNIPPCAVTALLKCSKGCTLSHCICSSLHINVTSIYKGWQPQTTKMHSTYKETKRETMSWKSLDKTRKSITGFRVREHLPTVNWLFLSTEASRLGDETETVNFNITPCMLWASLKIC